MKKTAGMGSWRLRTTNYAYLLWALAFGWLSWQGNYRTFLANRMGLLMMLGCILCLIFGIGSGWRAKEDREPALVRGSWISSLILILPMLFIFSAWGQSLGGYALSRGITEQQAFFPGGPSITPTPSMMPENYGELSVADTYQPLNNPHVNLFDLRSTPERFANHTVIVQGMVFRGAKTPPGHLVLFRFVVACCVADAQPVFIMVRSPQADNLPNDSWIEVEGILFLEKQRGLNKFYLDAKRLRQIDGPPQKYMYQF